MLQKFIDFPKKIYPPTPLLDYTLQNTASLIHSMDSFTYVLVYNEQEIVGRFAYGSNRLLRDESGHIIGQIALVESVNDYAVYSYIMKTAIQFLPEHDTVLYPFFFSTWHQYRLCVQKEIDFFLDQPCLPYYADFIKRWGFKKKYKYKSSRCNDLKTVLNSTRDHYETACAQRISFRHLNTAEIEQELKVLYDLSLQGFKDNIFYSPLSFDEFSLLYRKTVKIVDPECIIIAEDVSHDPVAFLFTIPDYTTLLQGLNLNSLWGKLQFVLQKKSKPDGLLVKSTAVLPEMRKHSVYSAMLHLQAALAVKRGYTYLVHAYYLESNCSSYYLTDISAENRYELYQLHKSHEEFNG
jgi:hypothetical protein